MDFANKAMAQLAELFKSLSPGARVVTGLLLTLVVVSLAWLFNYRGVTADAYLLHGAPLDTAELNAIVAALGKANLTNFEIEGGRIKVPRSLQSKYMAALADENALPSSFGSALDKAVRDNSPWRTKVQTEEHLKVAKQLELQRTISQMKGIESASVLYDMQTKRGLRQENVVTAAVSVKPLGTLPLDEEKASSIRHLVAASIAGLKAESVTLTDLNTGKRFGGGGAAGSLGSAAEDPYATRKLAYEKQYQDSISQALTYIKNATVTVNVELQPESVQEENVMSYDKDGAVLRVRETTGEKTQKGVAPGGRPGLAAQGNQPAQVGTLPGPEGTESTSDVEKSFGVPITQKHTVRQGLIPKIVTVAVGVPSAYYQEVFAQLNPTLPGQTPKKPDAKALADIEKDVQRKIENHVVNLIPRPADATQDAFPRVQVTSFQSLPSEPPPLPGTSDKVLEWLLDNWSTLAVAGLALVSLVMLRSLLKALPAPSLAAASGRAPSLPADTAPTVAAAATAAAESASVGEETSNPRSRLKRRSAGGPSLRDELAELVREDPDTAVNVLRNWIGSAT